MKNQFLMRNTPLHILFILILLNACTRESKNNSVLVSTDTIVHKKTIVVYETETVKVIKTPVIIDQTRVEKPITPEAPKPIQPVKRKKNPTKKIQPLPVYKFPTDTEYHYYSNKKISVKISPWKNEERSILLFDYDRNITYTFEDVRHSYSYFTELSYHPNGAVSIAVTHLNPGASMYWYETEIQFTEYNIPITKKSTQFPTELDNPPSIQYWNVQKKQWVDQLTIECQPPPQKQ